MKTIAPRRSRAAEIVVHTLPELPYAMDALEPHLDRRTMEFHHGKHHAAYVNALNKALEGAGAVATWSLDDLCRKIERVPKKIRTAVSRNAGQHWNHSLFWTLMAPPRGAKPGERTTKALESAFGGFEDFKDEFKEAATKLFGSGWVWLARTPRGKHEIVPLPDEENPLMHGMHPVLVLDVWEHAYYLQYQNRRADFVDAWWNVVNWEAVERRI
jgi:Fe-Mn family superoxide dismutase